MQPLSFLADEAEGNKTYIFWCELAEGRIEIFRVVRLRETKQIWFLSPEAEGNIVHIIIGQQG